MTDQDGRPRIPGGMPAAWTAILLALALSFLTACAARPAATPDAVFPFMGALRRADTGNEAFPLAADIRLRAVAAFPGGVWAWSHGDATLRLYDASGDERRAWPLDAAAVWLSPSLALSRSELFQAGGGFTYTLHSLDSVSGPRLAATWTLDSFPSDVAFTRDGVLLAGADIRDSLLTLRYMSAQAEPVVVAELPKRDDFLRVIAGPSGLLLFGSARERAARELELHVVAWDGAGQPPERAFRTLALDGLPDGALCWYGSGFFFGGRYWLPLAMANGDTVLAGISVDGDRAFVDGLAAGTGGVYAPLGPAADGSSFRYLAYDHEREPGVYRLAEFDGLSVSLSEPLR